MRWVSTRGGGAALVWLGLAVAAHAQSSEFGTACSVDSCSCAGFCLSEQKGKIVDTPPDRDGYAYKFSLCAAIPNEQLPTGCMNTRLNNIAVVRYNVSTPLLVLTSARCLIRWHAPVAMFERSWVPFALLNHTSGYV